MGEIDYNKYTKPEWDKKRITGKVTVVFDIDTYVDADETYDEFDYDLRTDIYNFVEYDGYLITDIDVEMEDVYDGGK